MTERPGRVEERDTGRVSDRDALDVLDPNAGQRAVGDRRVECLARVARPRAAENDRRAGRSGREFRLVVGRLAGEDVGQLGCGARHVLDGVDVGHESDAGPAR